MRHNCQAQRLYVSLAVVVVAVSDTLLYLLTTAQNHMNGVTKRWRVIRCLHGAIVAAIGRATDRRDDRIV